MLDKAGIDYIVESDIDRMLSMGLTHLPMLNVEGQMLDYKAAFKWLNERTNIHAN